MPTLLSSSAYAARRLSGQLRRAETPSAAVLADVLDACGRPRPNRSAACPMCAAAFQQAAGSAADRFIGAPAQARRGRKTAITIVPASGCLLPEELSAEACDRVAAEVLAAFAAAGLPPSLIGLEVSFNEDLTGADPAHASAHTHGITVDWLSAKQADDVRERFPASELTKRPVFVERFDGRIEGTLYPFKPERVRRQTYLNDRDPNRPPYLTTRRKELRPWQATSLALVDHERGYGGRLLSHGIDVEALWGHLRAAGWARDGP